MTTHYRFQSVSALRCQMHVGWTAKNGEPDEDIECGASADLVDNGGASFCKSCYNKLEDKEPVTAIGRLKASEAIAEIDRGAAMRRKDWMRYIVAEDGIIINVWPSGRKTRYHPTDLDLLAADWEGTAKLDYHYIPPSWQNWCECEEFGQHVAIPCAATTCPTVNARLAKERREVEHS